MAGSNEKLEHGPGLLASLWRFRYALLAAVVVAAVLGYLLSSLQSPTYSTSALIVLREDRGTGLFSDATFTALPDQNVPQQANIAASDEVMARAAESLGNVVADDLGDIVEIGSDISLNQLTITAEAESADQAAARANAVSDAYVSVARQQSLADVENATAVIDEQIKALRDALQEENDTLRDSPGNVLAQDRVRTTQDQLLALQTKVAEITADATAFGSGVRLRQEAEVPESPTSPQPLRDAGLTAVLVFVVGAVVAYWRAGMRRRVEARTDPSTVRDVSLLGEIPRFRNAGATGPLLASEAGEAYEFVLSSIEFALAELDGSTVLVTSATPGDGKTTTALALAMASAREGRGVILVDTDVRAHGLTSLLRAESHPGMVELAADEVTLDEAIRRYRLSDTVQLSVLPSGRQPEDPTGMVRTPEFKRAIRGVRERAELLILDSSPLLAVADATVLASQADAIVLVVDSNTELDQLLKVKERLAFVNTPVIGYIYNRANVDRSTMYGYGYGSSKSTSGGGWGGGFRSLSGAKESVGAGSNGSRR